MFAEADAAAGASMGGILPRRERRRREAREIPPSATDPNEAKRKWPSLNAGQRR